MRSRLLFFLLLFAIPARAVLPDAPLDDPAQEARAKALIAQMRCVVCEGEPLADSRTEVAADIRRAVREQVQAGAGDRQIKDYLVSRYGEAILLNPALRPATFPLWLGPLVIFLAAALAASFYFRQRRHP